MTSLPEFDINYKYFLDQSALLFGETRTGKSSIVVDILHHLKPHVEQVIVIAPMDQQNHTYDRGIVPPPCIHYSITAELLQNIWDRQNALSVVYTRANRPAVLARLFSRLTHVHQAHATIHQINEKLESFRSEIEENEPDQSAAKAKIATMENDCKELITKIWRHYIGINAAALEQMRLTPDEVYTLKYLNLNPRLILVFDDCTAELKKFNTNPVMKKLFYQGRWAYITFIIACHTDKCIDPELKKNAFVNIYTEDSCATAYFERPSNNFNKETRTKANNALKAAITPMARFQKLVWVREEKKFYRYTATLRPQFEFGGDIVREYCRRCQADETNRTSNNKFINEFT